MRVGKVSTPSCTGTREMRDQIFDVAEETRRVDFFRAVWFNEPEATLTAPVYGETCLLRLIPRPRDQHSDTEKDVG